MKETINIAVFASGGGSNFQSLIDRKEEGRLHVNFAVMVGNNSTAKAFERATQHDIPTLHCAPCHFDSEEAYVEKILSEFESKDVDLIVLAGYMKMIPMSIVKKYHNRIINIHPGLLPSFGGKGMYGKRVHQAVLDYGAKISGVTVHFVNEEYDRGPVIFQEIIHVEDGDTADSLAARVLKLEHTHYWRVVEAVAQGYIKIDGRKVIGRV